jgi:hypothetical protein
LAGEVAGTFKRGAGLGGGVAEWAHPQKQVGIALARDVMRTRIKKYCNF